MKGPQGKEGPEMKRLSVSICVVVIIVFFGLPVGCPAGHADDSTELSLELSQSSTSSQQSFQLARLGSRRFVRRGVPSKSTSKFRNGLPRKSFTSKSFNLFPSRRINDIRRRDRTILRDLNLRQEILNVPRKDFVNPRKGVLQKSRDVRKSMDAQRNAIMKQFDTERLRR